MKSLYRRIVIAVVGVIAIAYISSVVIVSGKDLGVSESLYDGVRDAYMRPHLMQSWGLFAKGIVNSDKTIVMRAQVQNADGGVTTTDWVDIGAYDWSGVLHEATPTRDARTSFKIAGDLQIAIRTVPNVVRPAISADILKKRSLNSQDYIDTLSRTPDLNAASKRAVAAFVNLDNTTTRLTTLYAYRFWNRPVVAVQWNVVITPVPRFDERHTDTTGRPNTVAATGWRTAAVFDEATIRAWTQ